MAAKPYYITTAISYPNGPPHIGHAYEAIATDAIARFMRLDGYDVYFLTGTDEHGQKIQQTAAREGLTPRQLLDRNVPLFEAMVKLLECSNDDFIHTTEAASPPLVGGNLAAHGEERRHLSRQICRLVFGARRGLLRRGRNRAQRAEGAHRDSKPARRSNGWRRRAISSVSRPIRTSCSSSTPSDPNYVLPKERLNEVASFVRGGLQDLSISRTTFDWGVRVPGATATSCMCGSTRSPITSPRVGYPDTDSEKFRRYWPADLHVIGKDIVRFHAVYWPAFLMSAGIAVPRRIFSHGFLFNRGEKMSKSVGNVIDPFALADAYGVDPLRYFFLREVPFGQDGNYSHEAIVNRINADLANDLGNLAQRSLTMVARNFGGVLPKPAALSEADQAILAAADAMIAKARDAMKTQQLHQVLNAVWAVVADANRYFAGEAPWALAKTDPERQGTVLYVTAEVLRQIAILALPFVPASAEKLLDLLAVPRGERSFSVLGGSHRIAAGKQASRARAGVSRVMSSRRHPPHILAMLVDSHCHLDFPDFAGELDAVVARARAAGIGRMVTISTRVHRHAGVLAIAERFPTSSARSAPIRITPTRSSTSRRPNSLRACATRKSWRSAKRASTITTTTARATRRSAASAITSRRRAKPGCRWSSIRATATPTWRGFWRRKPGRAPSRPCCIASPAAAIWRSAPSRSGSTSRSPAS